MTPPVLKTFSALLLTLLAGCGVAPTLPDNPAATADDPLPIRLAVDMTPEQLTQWTSHYYYYTEIYYPEGRLVRNAALDAFAPLVSQVLPREQMPTPDVIIKVSGKGSFNPLMKVFYADVSVTAYLPGGEELGTFKSSSEVGAIVSGYECAFQSAYLAAFQSIGRKLLASGVLSSVAPQN
ncbi:MAG TPA: hypothetical protein VHE58_03055 [Burkholderiales bacterium]|nr:hypothetical protein [Burkholderiales bacterium]